MIVEPLPTMPIGNKYIIMVGELYTKYAEVFPVPNIKITDEAQIFIDNNIFRHIYQNNLSDTRSNFTSELIKEICTLLNITIHKLQATIRNLMDLLNELMDLLYSPLQCMSVRDKSIGIPLPSVVYE